jgi:chemotaxis signal transduction protein
MTLFVLATSSGRRFAVPVEHVRCAIAAAETTPLVESTPFTIGILNLHQELIPVIDTRKALGATIKIMEPQDKFIVLDLAHQAYALWVDEIQGVKEIASQEIANPNQVESAEALEGIIKSNEGLIWIMDWNKIVNQERVMAHGS